MKKLMIAAVAAASAGFSFAGDCGCEDTCSTKCVYAYEVILLAKTTSGKPVGEVKTDACSCEETICGAGCYRKPLMRKFAGFVWGDAARDAVEGCGVIDAECGSACGCIDFGATEMGQIFWDVKTKKQLVDAKLAFEKIDAIGYKSRETIEAYGTFSFTEGEIDAEVTLAGFGKRGKRANGTIMPKSLSGFFAGAYPCLCTSCGPDAEDKCKDTCTTSIAIPWSLCCDAEEADDDGLTAAYGKWTLNWNATAAQKLTANFSETVLVKPGYEYVSPSL